MALEDFEERRKLGSLSDYDVESIALRLAEKIAQNPHDHCLLAKEFEDIKKIANLVEVTENYVVLKQKIGGWVLKGLLSLAALGIFASAAVYALFNAGDFFKH